jgi:hypothetical protein
MKQYLMGKEKINNKNQNGIKLNFEAKFVCIMFKESNFTSKKTSFLSYNLKNLLVKCLRK